MRVLVAGAAGVIGMPLVRLLTSAGHEVVAVTRSSAKLDRLRDAGAEPVICDALDAETLGKTVGSAQPEVVVNQLTALPRRIRPRRIGRDLAATSRLRSQGTRNLMAAAQTAGVAHVVAQSVAFAYAPDVGQPDRRGHDGLRRERDPLYIAAPGEFARAVRAITELEAETLDGGGISAAVLRYGFFYGLGTSYAADGTVADDVRRRRFPVIGGGTGVFCFTHVHDAARATLAAIEQRAEGTYNVVDDEPAPVAEWLPVYAALLGALPPRRLPQWLGSMLGGPYAMYLMTQMPGASNEQAKAALGWRPLQPSWRGGFREDLVGQR